MVVVTHWNWTRAERLYLLFPFWIDMAVPFFMTISGFVFSKSFVRRRITTIENAYSLSWIIDKFIRYTVPFLIAFLFEEAIAVCSSERIGILQMLYGFLSGRYGPGSYYYPVMIQFIFWFPVIYFIVKKYDRGGVLVCFGINAAYELLQRAYGMNEECYRLLLFRYTFLIGFGCYLAIGKQSIRKVYLLLGMVVGAVVQFLFRGDNGKQVKCQCCANSAQMQ